MAFVARRILACLAPLAVTVFLPPAGCGKAPVPPVHPWLVIRGTCPLHTVKVEINGKPYAVIEKRNPPADIRRTPLKEGVNRIVLTFQPRKDANTVGASHMEVRLSADIRPSEDGMPGLECEASERVCEYRIELELKDGLPGELRYTRRDWADDARAKLLFEQQVKTGAAEGEPREVSSRQWNAEGRLVLETNVKESVRLTEGKFYRPDGTLGAEVKDGGGVRREWYKNGAVAKETPFVRGLVHGEEKTFYETGQIERVVPFREDLEEGEAELFDRRGRASVRGRFSGGHRDGAWIRFDREGKEIARSFFRDGKRVEGTDDFGEFSAEE